MAKQSHSAIHITFKPTDGIGKQVKCVYRPAADGSGTLIVDETRILFNKLVIAPLVEKNGYSGPITKILFEYSLFGPDEEDMEYKNTISSDALQELFIEVWNGKPVGEAFPTAKEAK